MSGRLFADVTQSWSEKGGGVRVYLNRKRRFILERTSDRHLLIIPGAADKVEGEGRAITVTIKSPHVPGSPNYRLLLRNGAVREALGEYQPDLIECQDAYNLPWAALAHRQLHPDCAVVASFMTDFPTAYTKRIGERIGGAWLGRFSARIAYRYLASLYRKADAVVALSEHGGAARLRSIGVEQVAVAPLGVDIEEFAAVVADRGLRDRAGCRGDSPLLIYVGRLDVEKRASTVVEAFGQLSDSLGARLVLLGDGPLRKEFAGTKGVYSPGFVKDRAELARWLASADLYVSGMADETFGISVIEAQASGLPVVGVASGAMIDRVPPGLGLLGPVDDSRAMAANIMALLADPQLGEFRARAIAHAATISWDKAMQRLFEQIYPEAIKRRAAFKTSSRGVAEHGVPK